MRTVDSYLQEYSQSHRNPVNTAIHLVCVPLIYLCSLGLAWTVPVGRWLNLPADWQPWINLATLSLLPQLIFYARLSAASFATGLVWMALSIAAIVGMQRLGLPLLAICATVWVLAWIGQFYGHKVEGAKPSFAKDLVFLFIGPLYVTDKLRHGGVAAGRTSPVR